MSTASTPDGERTSGPRSPKGARTRARLVDAAKQVFEEIGFLDARISDIAERAGLSHGSFYHYFDSKEEVFLEVAEAQGERFTGDALIRQGLVGDLAGSDGAESGGRVADRLRAAVRRYLEMYRDEARIMGVIEQVSRYHGPVREVRAAQQQQYFQQAEEAIRELQRHGLVDPALDPPIAAAALVGMMVRFAELWLVQGQLDCDFDEGVETLTAVCLKAVRLTELAG